MPSAETRVARLELRCEPDEIAHARRFVAETLSRWGIPDLDVDAMLLTSETVSNAVLHAQTPIQLRLTLRQGRLRIAVKDGSPRMPRRRDTAGDLADGLGLAIVAKLAADYGVQRSSDGGKVIWFELLAG